MQPRSREAKGGAEHDLTISLGGAAQLPEGKGGALGTTSPSHFVQAGAAGMSVIFAEYNNAAFTLVTHVTADCASVTVS